MAVKIYVDKPKFDEIIEGAYNSKITNIREHEQTNRFSGAKEVGFLVEFTIIDEGVHKDLKAVRFFTPFITPKSKLWALFRAAYQRELTETEMVSINGVEELISMLVGKIVVVTIKNFVSRRTMIKYYHVTDFLHSTLVKPVPTDNTIPYPATIDSQKFEENIENLLNEAKKNTKKKSAKKPVKIDINLAEVI